VNGTFSFLQMIIQVTWICFSPVTILLSDYFGVSTYAVNTLSLIWMISYAGLSFLTPLSPEERSLYSLSSFRHDSIRGDRVTQICSLRSHTFCSWVYSSLGRCLSRPLLAPLGWPAVRRLCPGLRQLSPAAWIPSHAAASCSRSVRHRSCHVVGMETVSARWPPPLPHRLPSRVSHWDRCCQVSLCFKALTCPCGWSEGRGREASRIKVLARLCPSNRLCLYADSRAEWAPLHRPSNLACRHWHWCSSFCSCASVHPCHPAKRHLLRSRRSTHARRRSVPPCTAGKAWDRSLAVVQHEVASGWTCVRAIVVGRLCLHVPTLLQPAFSALARCPAAAFEGPRLHTHN